MSNPYLVLFLLCCLGSCKQENETHHQIPFDKNKWILKEDLNYPFRDLMVKEVLYSDSIRASSKADVLNKLGAPDKINQNHLYYMISQNRLGLWPLHTKTLVIKCSDADSVEWIKLHE